MRLSRLWIVTLAAIGLIVVSGLLWAWPANYALWAPGPAPPFPGGSATGANWMSFPFSPPAVLNDAEDLINDINGQGGSVVSVSRYDTLIDGLITYTGVSGTNFPLMPDEGYQIAVSGDSNYVIPPAHNVLHTVNFDPPGATSLTGTHWFALPDHRVPLDINARGLITLVDRPCCGGVNAVCRFIRSNNGLDCYDGVSGNNFPLVPGEAYQVNVNTGRSFQVP